MRGGMLMPHYLIWPSAVKPVLTPILVILA